MTIESARNLLTRLRRALARRFMGGVEYARFLGVRVGTGCRVLTRTFGSEPFLITIGNDVTISNDVRFVTHDGATWLIRDEAGRRFSYAPIVIGNSVFVGAGSTLMPGISIGDNVIVGAASVVTKSIPSGVVVAGNPARVIARYRDFADRHLTSSATARDLDCLASYEARVMSAIVQHPRPCMVNPFNKAAHEADNAQS